MLEIAEVDATGSLLEIAEVDATGSVLEAAEVDATGSVLEAAEVDATGSLLEAAEVDATGSLLEAAEVDATGSLLEIAEVDASGSVLEIANVDASGSLLEAAEVDATGSLIASAGFGRSVASDGANSISSNMFLLNCTIPVQENPDIIFLGVIASGKASRTIPGIWYIVIVWPGLFNIQESQTLLTAFLNGPYTPLSNGCSLWEV